jgi:uncharacterized protein
VSDDISGSGARPSATASLNPPRRSVLLPTLVTLGVLLLLLAVFTGVWTDRLWFNSVDYSSVFSKVLLTRALLFVAGALLLAGLAALNAVLAYRSRPFVRAAASPRNEALDRWRTSIDPVRGRVLAVATFVLGVLAGSVASGQWQTYLLWRHGTAWDQDDVYFHKDIGFYVFDYPWYRFVTSFIFVTLAVCIIAAVVTHYLYGGIDLQARRDRLTGAAQTHLSILVGLFVLLKAWAYWLDRFGFLIADGGRFTGVQYTDDHARIPAKNILIVIAIICALLLFANAVRRNWLLPGLGLGLLVFSSILLSGVWPAIMQTFQVKPSEPDKESPFIERSISATRDAYDLSEVKETGYAASTNVSQADLAVLSEALPNTRLLDPTLVSPAFTQLQQVRGFYSVPETLDVDRYRLAGEANPQDVVVAAREIHLDGLDESQRNWANDHTAYTHGFGVIAAYGDRRGAEGQPEWAESQIPPQGAITDLSEEQSEDGKQYEPRIYFGENTPEYSIVGAPEGTNVEIDYPTSADSSSEPTLTTYSGDGGVPVGGIVNKVLYALKFGEPNIVLSGRVNSDSRILYDRDPRERVEKVAPWLTVDGNAYPAVVGEQLLWIVDGYTTSNSYPMANRVDLDSATADTNTEEGSTAALPSDQITYMRNSVRATVDAYSGEVTLYQWDEEDPIVQAWMDAFPGTVEPASEIEDALREHLRYPEDLFKVQREVLQTYHVEDPSTFYQGSERWAVPNDPAASASVLQPPYYLSVQLPEVDEDGQVTGALDPSFSLTSVYVPNERQNLASFVAVDSDPMNDTYGDMTLLSLDQQISGPEQIANQFQSDESVADALLSYRQADVSVLYGNLLTVPAGDGLLYVQPIYTQRSSTSGSGTYPQLQFVLASFGENVGIGQTLEEALADALGTAPPDDTPPPPDGGPGPEGPGTQPPGGVDRDAVALLRRADATYTQALDALAAGDLGTYQQLVEKSNRLTAEALDMLLAESGGTEESPAPSETTPPPETEGDTG